MGPADARPAEGGVGAAVGVEAQHRVAHAALVAADENLAIGLDHHAVRTIVVEPEVIGDFAVAAEGLVARADSLVQKQRGYRGHDAIDP